MKRTAFVTGANRGLGFAIAKNIAVLGHLVYLGSRDLKAGEGAAASLRHRGLVVVPVQVDLAREATFDSAIATIGKSGRSVDVLVNNAGILHEKPLLDLTDEEIADSIAVHITGPIRLIRAIAPSMAAARSESLAWRHR